MERDALANGPPATELLSWFAHVRSLRPEDRVATNLWCARNAHSSSHHPNQQCTTCLNMCTHFCTRVHARPAPISGPWRPTPSTRLHKCRVLCHVRLAVHRAYVVHALCRTHTRRSVTGLPPILLGLSDTSWIRRNGERADHGRHT
jgi:hypothetical protein